MMRPAKFLLRLLLKLLYGVEVSGFEHYEKAGDRVLIVANHTSLLDGLLLYAWLPETPTFAINTQIAEQKRFRFFLRFVDLFIMDPNNPLSVKSMIRFIRGNKKAVIFPEGRITITGSLMKVYDGPGLIADKADATVLPVCISGAQLSPFSYMKGRGFIRTFPKIRMIMLPPEKFDIAEGLSGHARRQAVGLKMHDIMNKLVYASFDQRTTLYASLLEAADRFGHKRVILEDSLNMSLTYKQLILKSQVLARKFEQLTDDNETVGVLLPNTLALPVTFFALSHLRRLPAMLNYTAGIQSILRALETGKIKRIITARGFIEKAGLEELLAALEEVAEVIILEDLRDQISFLDKLAGLYSSFRVRARYKKQADNYADDAAVILFTSGSEGTPKGVVLSHANLLANRAQINCNIDFKPNDIIFSCLPMFHSFGLNAGLITPILGGARVYIYPTPLHYRIIPELFYEIGATILFGTNTFFQGYARHAHAFDFNSARYVIAGAEPLREDTIQLWMHKFGIRIYQGYGVTETSPVISVNTPKHSIIGSVGRCVPEVECKLIKTEGIHDGGRLLVRGPNIMLGYLHHGGDGKPTFPETEHGAGWYDTGDIASINDEGYLYIQGRAKRFAKIGGEMVSLTSVEDLAMKIWPNANHAAVNLADDRKGEKIILITDYADANRKAFQEYVKQNRYSELAIPKSVLFTQSFPVLGTGKIDFPTLTTLAREADQSGESWLHKLSHLVHKKHDSDEKDETKDTA